MIMPPNESFGCGKSYKWETFAIDIARETGEACSHLTIFTVDVIFNKSQEKYGPVTCRVSCPQCDSKYLETSKKLAEIFNNFYGRS